MRKTLLTATAAVFAFGVAGAAHAVDVVNEDAETYKVTISDGEDTTTYELTGGESLLDICEKCSVQIGDSEAVAAEGDQVAVIKQGKVELKKKTF